MAHFAELDSNNKVLRVVVACNQDISNNGGEQSKQAEEHFKIKNHLSENGVRWVQTSYNNNFRKQYAGVGFIYDQIKDKFISPKPFTSWSLDINDDWKPPIEKPSILTYEDNKKYILIWDEPNIRWIGFNEENIKFIWNPQSFSWIIENS
jgi:hypothetical protein